VRSSFPSPGWAASSQHGLSPPAQASHAQSLQTHGSVEPQISQAVPTPGPPGQITPATGAESPKPATSPADQEGLPAQGKNLRCPRWTPKLWICFFSLSFLLAFCWERPCGPRSSFLK